MTDREPELEIGKESGEFDISIWTGVKIIKYDILI